MQETKEQNRALTKRYIQAWNNRDFKVMKGMLSPDFTFTLLNPTPITLSRDRMLGVAMSMTTGIPDMKIEIQQTVAEGDTVVIRSIVTGTHEGDFQEQPATGNKIEFTSIVIYRVKNGRIVDEKELSDTLSFSQQLKPKDDDEQPGA